MIHSKDVPIPHTRLRGMAAVVDGPSALRAFLAALDVPQHEFSMVQLGFGDITAFAGFDDATARAMDDALEGAGVPPGHSGRIRRAVIKCRNTSTPHGAATGATAAGTLIGRTLFDGVSPCCLHIERVS